MKALKDLRQILKTIAQDVEVLPAVGGAVPVSRAGYQAVRDALPAGALPGVVVEGQRRPGAGILPAVVL